MTNPYPSITKVQFEFYRYKYRLILTKLKINTYILAQSNLTGVNPQTDSWHVHSWIRAIEDGYCPRQDNLIAANYLWNKVK